MVLASPVSRDLKSSWGYTFTNGLLGFSFGHATWCQTRASPWPLQHCGFLVTRTTTACETLLWSGVAHSFCILPWEILPRRFCLSDAGLLVTADSSAPANQHPLSWGSTGFTPVVLHPSGSSAPTDEKSDSLFRIQHKWPDSLCFLLKLENASLLCLPFRHSCELTQNSPERSVTFLSQLQVLPHHPMKQHGQVLHSSTLLSNASLCSSLLFCF